MSPSNRTPPESDALVEEAKPYLPAEHMDERRALPAGFQLRRLRLQGTNVPPAELRFIPGLNVVSGPSNTGKSFAFYCLDFMLGAKRLVKQPAEAEAYDEAFLEIESAAGETFTLRRALSGGRFRWYAAAFDAIGQGVPTVGLKAKHTGQQTDSASAQYLALSGLANRLLLKSRVNRTTQPLSFRNVADFVVIGEEQIITADSPVTGPNRVANTAEISLFQLLLTGRDAGDVEPVESRADGRRRLLAQADVLDELIDASRAAGEPEGDREELERRRVALDRQVDEFASRAESAARATDEVAGEIEAEQASVLEARSRVLVVDELLARFRLLRASYETDLARLTLIQTGSDLLAQLPPVTCPTCGQPMGDAHAAHGPTSDSGEADGPQPVADLGPEVRAACATEAAKIRLHLADLAATVDQLVGERTALAERVRGGTARVRALEQRVQEELRPQLAGAVRAVREVIRVRQEVLRAQAAERHRSTLVDRRFAIDRAIRQLREAGAEPAPPAEEVTANGLAAAVRRLLSAWRYPDLTSVQFDADAMDLVISGRPRQDQGKGVRAILYSAFVVGLMRRCQAEDRPHPGFVVLDSPLTTYKGPALPEARGPEDVPVDMETAFFLDLAGSTRDGASAEQVIVFDNKEPPAELRARINYVQFTGRWDVGRVGFIPAGAAPG